MRHWTTALALVLGLTAYSALAADPPKAVEMSKLLANPAAYEGKAVVVRATVSGAVVEGPKWLRLSVNGQSAARGANSGKTDAPNFVIPKDQRDRLTKDWKADATYTADLTVTLERGTGAARAWWAVVSEVTLKDSGVATKTADPVPTKPADPVAKQTADPVPTKPADPVAKQTADPVATRTIIVVQPTVSAVSMSLRQLLDAYDPSEAENAVGERLAKVTKGQASVVFNRDGTVDATTSETLIKEIKDGFPPRSQIQVNGVPHKTYKVGESPNKLYAENPLYPASALRSDGMCDRTERTWEGVPLVVRQVIYLGVTKTGEIKVERVDDAHAILDKLTGTPAHAEEWVKVRYPKAYLLYQDLKDQGGLPSLKLTSIKPPTVDEPKPADQPKPPTTTGPARPPEKPGV